MQNTYLIHNAQGAYLMTVKAKNEEAAIKQAKKKYQVAKGYKLSATLITNE